MSPNMMGNRSQMSLNTTAPGARTVLVRPLQALGPHGPPNSLQLAVSAMGAVNARALDSMVVDVRPSWKVHGLKSSAVDDYAGAVDGQD